jgi:predicted hydrocarbon binding protein
MPGNKDVLVYMRERGRKLFLVALDLEDQVGALADVSTRMEKVRFNVVSGFVSAPGPDDVGRCSFVGVATDRALTASGLKRALEASDKVVACRVKEAHRDILVDSFNFPLTWNNGDRAVMLRVEFFSEMKQTIHKVLQSGADVVLYELGYEHGAPSWKSLLSDFSVDDAAGLQEVLHIYDAVGWGRVEVVSFDKPSKTATVRMRDNFECSVAGGRDPSSHFVRGHLAGAFSAVFGSEAKVVETKCIAVGDEYCEFAVNL